MSAGRERRSVPGARALAIAAAALLIAALASGCSDLHRYWDRSPTGPESSHDTSPPVVRVLSPSGADSSHATAVGGTAFSVAIDARDDVGVVGVTLHVDQGAAISVSGPPWQGTWNTTAVPEGGLCRLWASAVDAAGNVGVSAPVYARAYNTGPAISLLDPADGARVLGSIPLSATVAAAAGGLAQVDFLADGASFATRTAPPWTTTLNTATLTAGDHFLAASARTNTGAISVSAPVRIRVNNGSPAITVDFPDDGHQVATLGTLILSGHATDVVEGALPPERFTWASSVDGPLGTGPYLRVRGLTVGTHTVTVSAANAWGTPASASVQVEVLATPTYGYCARIYNQIIVPHCFSCHRPASQYFAQSHLDMTSYALFKAGGGTTQYECIAPSRPDSSLVLNKLTADVPWVGAPMPPRDQFPALPANLIQMLRTWISEGAPPDANPTCP